MESWDKDLETGSWIRCHMIDVGHRTSVGDGHMLIVDADFGYMRGGTGMWDFESEGRGPAGDAAESGSVATPGADTEAGILDGSEEEAGSPCRAPGCSQSCTQVAVEQEEPVK